MWYPGTNDLPNGFLNDFNRTLGIEDVEAFWFGGGHGQIGLSNAFVEIVPFRVEAVGTGLPVAKARLANLDREIEEQRQIGNHPSRGNPYQVVDENGIVAAGISLIGAGRIGEPVAENQFPTVHPRTDNRFDVLGAVGGVQQRLGQRCRNGVGSVMGFEEQTANREAERRSAGFAGFTDGVPHLSQALGEKPKLRGFSASVDSFEGDEKTTRHWVRGTGKRSGYPWSVSSDRSMF